MKHDMHAAEIRIGTAREASVPESGEEMTRQQALVVVMAVLITLIDGFDVQAMAFAAPAVGEAWHIGKATLGFVLGSSLFGMAGGSLLLSPLADRFGRRPLVFAGLVLMTLGSLVAALAGVVWQLALGRILTGIGVGVMIPVTTTIAAEFASPQRRSLAVAGTTVGHSVGGAVGGLIAALLLKYEGWPWIFGAGAVAGTVMLLIAVIALPESPSFLAANRAAEGAAALSPKSPLMPEQAATHAERGLRRASSYRALFANGRAIATLRLALVYILLVMAAYYLLSWLPQLVADTGYPPSTASMITGITSLVGIASGLLAGSLANRIGPAGLASTSMIGFGLSLVGIGLAPPTLLGLTIAASICAFFLSASTAVFYATLAASFPAQSRVSGIGFVMGFGRLLSGFGPYVAGIMFAAGLARGEVSMIFALAAVSAGLLLFLSRGRSIR